MEAWIRSIQPHPKKQGLSQDKATLMHLYLLLVWAAGFGNREQWTLDWGGITQTEREQAGRSLVRLRGSGREAHIYVRDGWEKLCLS